jgi:hypothetical protein
MLLLTTAALPQLEQHRHPNLGRLITPRHYARLDDTLAAGLPVAVDNDCFQGLDPVAVCRMLGAVMPWPSVGARIRRAWPMLAVGSEAVLGFEVAHDVRDGYPQQPRMRPRRSSCSGSGTRGSATCRSPMCFRRGRTDRAGCPGVRPGWPRCSSAAALAGSSGPTPPRSSAKRAGADCWPIWAGAALLGEFGTPSRSAAPRSTARGSVAGAPNCSTTASPGPASRRNCG